MGKWTLERLLQIGALIFWIGVSWAYIADFKVFKEDTVPNTYVRKDVYDAQQRNLLEAVNEQSATNRELAQRIAELLALERQTGEPSRVQRMFDK